MKTTSSATVRFSLLIMALLIAVQVAIFAAAATAAAFHSDLAPSLPPRPPLTTPMPKKEGTAAVRSQSARLELIVANHEPGLWSVVQWRDANGDWQDVDGWRAPVGSKPTEWWVETKDFGKGPFRWIVYKPGDTDAGAAVLIVSELFHLPRAVGEAVTIKL